MLDSTNIKQINEALKNSFATIKKDIDEIRITANSKTHSYDELRKEIESIKSNIVSKDKLNVLYHTF